MIFRDLLKTGTRMANANAPVLLTAFGAVGVVTTAVLTGKAAYESHERLENARVEKFGNAELEKGVRVVDVELTKLEIVNATWTLYLPAVTSGVITVGAVVLSHRVSSRRAAALAAAYALSEGRIEEYQEKIKEKFGLKEEKAARDDLAQDKVNRDHEDGLIVWNPNEGKVMLKDDYSGRYFFGTIEGVNKAVNELNREILNSMGSSEYLSAFYDAIGLEQVATSNHVGWNTDELCEVDWSTCTTPDGQHAVHVFSFVNPPVINPGGRGSFR